LGCSLPGAVNVSLPVVTVVRYQFSVAGSVSLFWRLDAGS
jgi:hypothetical protein